ncbi:peptide chain release factor N(5)-glutamine methyltransferase [Limnobacter humi]|uniref:Release factor glutamine methyltransferase n=1 Tax=Limnobacter humi TaxID=1778671 RepID=A0ABT1WK67_9BURK|nr:peptide chain release factor N(5)-glutamine methyltransferase [Limnobacter humi]MCQ8897486.1 peptide chain release factor N(5)-glutamine methyltransferase [Limnobacter humi]
MNPPCTINEALQHARRETAMPMLELRLLMQTVCGLTNTQIISRGGDVLQPEYQAHFMSLVQRRYAGEPIAYMLGEKEFYARPFKVTPAVLIPRPDTEDVVTQAIAWIKQRQAQQPNRTLRVLDIGTGSGAIALTLALECTGIDVLACDISVEALAVAQDNALRLQAPAVQFIQGDLLDAVRTHQPDARFDLIISNPPYIEAGDPHLDQGDLRHEPPDALTDHGDGLRFYRAIAQESPAFLTAGGAVIVEHGYRQQGAVVQLFQQGPFVSVAGFTDLSGNPRGVLASLELRRNTPISITIQSV